MDKEQKNKLKNVVTIVIAILAVGMVSGFFWRNTTKTETISVRQYSAHIMKGFFWPGDAIIFEWDVVGDYYVIVMLLDEESFKQQEEGREPTILDYENQGSGSGGYSVQEPGMYYLEIMSIQFFVEHVSVEITCNNNFQFEGVVY